MLKTKILFLTIFFCTSSCFKGILRYDSYTGNLLTQKEWQQRVKDNHTFWCVSQIEPCNPDEGRRLDGSCNNLKHPTRGASHTPFLRVLPADYDKIYEPRRAKSGGHLPLTRRVRTTLLAEGRVPSQTFTQLATNFMLLIVGDLVTVQDTVNYVVWRPYCCLSKGKKDFACVPNKIPADDPVHRFSNKRCQTMTRPISYQSEGCVRNDTKPDRLNSATPVLDLSTIYGSLPQLSLERLRLYKGGLLKYEEENGRIWPPSYKGENAVCILNEPPRETRCHLTPEEGINSLAGVNLLGIWFWRHHNYIANKLAKINPSWDDNKIFSTAREINIAMYLQIVYYELMPSFLGRDNMISDKVIASHQGFRDRYDETIVPQLSVECTSSLRWIHTMQEGILKMYDTEGNYLKQIPIVNVTLRTGFLAVDNNIDYMTQGVFRQQSANIDYVLDPHLGETAMGRVIDMLDVTTNDLAKSRYYGFPPYINYLELCYGKEYASFDDLADVIDPERIELLKDAYENVSDIDLTAGMWVEKIIEGGNVPPTFYCLVADQLLRNLVSDRHWYERPNRPYAFTNSQLKEIRKSSVARLLCDVGDCVTEIQPNAFLKAGPGNKIRSCKKIQEIDLNAWKDK